MRFIDRIIIFVFSLIFIAAAVFGAFLCFSTDFIYDEIFQVVNILINYRWFVLIVSALLFVIGLLIMFGSAFHHQRHSKSDVISTQTQGDDVQISVGAIDCIVGQVVKSYSQVKSVNTIVSESPEGIKVKAKTVVNGDINIPDLANNLREDIKIQLETMVGLKVKEVKIVVTDVVAKPITVEKNTSAKWDDVQQEESAEETVEEKK
jgi:uncharacterized alkaline shock family protein YloU